MRWSQAFVTFALFASVFSFTACRNEKSEKRPSVAAPTEAQPPSKQKQMASVAKTAQDCFQDLCSNKKELSYPAMMEHAAKVTPEQQKYYSDHVAKPTLKAIAETQANLNLFANRLDENEAVFEETQLSENQKRLLKALLLAFSSKHIPEDVRTKFNKKMAKFDIMKASSLVSIKGPEGFFEIFYPNVPIAQAAQNEAHKALELQDKINKMLNAHIINLESGSIGRIKNGEGIDTEDLTSLIYNSITMRLLETLTITDTSMTDAIPLETSQILKIYRESRLREKIRTRLASAEGLAKTCENNFYKAINLYPQPNEIESFKEMSEKVRTQVLSLLSTQDKAYSVVQKAPLYMPKDPKKITTHWLTRLKDDATEAATDRREIKKFTPSTLFFLAVIYSLNFKEENPLCDNIASFNISDATHTIDTGIRVSWFSVKNPAYGASILAHELGHLVSNYSTSFSSQKQCLIQKQGTKNYTEEDFADMIGGKVSLQLQNEYRNQGNFGCFLASTETYPSLNNKNKKDTHSSGLYRALQIAQLRKENIPASCQAVIQAEAPKTTQSCE